MSSSDYYWTRSLIRGFGKLWFLVVPQEADASGGGISLLGSVVKELSSGGILGLLDKYFPEPHHLTTPKLVLKSIESRRSELSLIDQEIV